MNSVKNRRLNPNTLPYGQLLKRLKGNLPASVYPIIIQYLLKKYNINSPIEIIGQFVENLKSQYALNAYGYSYNKFVKFANTLGWRVIGKPCSNTDDSYKTHYWGCQITSFNSKIIHISSGLNEIQAKATIAHEILHTIFNTTDTGRPGNLPSEELEEFLCDYGAARLLIPFENLMSKLNSFDIENLSQAIINLSGNFKITRNFLAMRLMDLDLKDKYSNVHAIIEWKRKDNSQPYLGSNIGPSWVICEDAFIPTNSNKKLICRLSERGIIYHTLMQNDRINTGHEIENVKIGGLKGRYLISSTSIFNKSEDNDDIGDDRMVLTVFISAD